MKIKRRIFIPMVALVIGCCIAVLMASIWQFNKELNDAMNRRLDVAMEVIENETEFILDKARLMAFAMRDNQYLVDAIDVGDHEQIRALAGSLRDIAQLDFCTIIDKEGIVVQRVHDPDRFGDSLAMLPHVNMALEGKIESFIVPGITIRLGVMAGSPIVDNDGNIVAVISLGFRFDSQEAVHTFKAHTGGEVMFLLGNEIVSSTVKNSDGDYGIGLTVDEDFIDTVLAGETYTGEFLWFDEYMHINIHPLYGADGDVIGMVLVGYNALEDAYKIAMFIFLGISLSLVILAICLLIARISSGVIERRLENMMDNVNEVNVRMINEKKNSEDRLKKILGEMNTMLLVTALDSDEILFINERFKKDFDFNDDIIGKKCWEVIVDGITERCPECPKNEMEINPDVINIRELRMSNNKSYRIISRIIDWPDGSNVYLEQYDDVTELHEAHDDLRKARDAAENANEAKSVFLAHMSHEIRTPMNSIIGFTELAQAHDVSPETSGYLKNILVSADWLLNIINDILDISKIESGKIELENIPFSLVEVFEQCQSSISPTIVEKGLSLYCYTEPLPGKKMLGDPSRLRQILMNLLSNAVKFTNVGMIKLLASIISVGPSKAIVRFEAKDSGIGISRENIDNIFEPFEQADDTVTRRFGGTGLGLSITKNIIELMGGQLNVRSEVGIGSTFSFELIFDLVDDIPDADNDNASIKHKIIAGFRGEVLICEDNALNQQVICEHLSRAGVKAVVASNGREGFEIVSGRHESSKEPFDIILMDIHMPIMDGLEAAIKIKELGVSTPIIALTANVMAHDLERYQKSGMNDTLGKPFTTHELWECLAKYLPVNTEASSEAADHEDSEKLQNQLKERFAKTHQNTYASFLKALDDKEIDAAHRIVHTLKSNAAQIGEDKLSAISKVVEEELSTGSNNLTYDLLISLETELKSVLDKLAPLLNEANKRRKIKFEAFDADKTLRIFERLEPLLEERSFDTIQFVDELAVIPGTDELVKHIDNFDFKNALEVLQSIKNNLIDPTL